MHSLNTRATRTRGFTLIELLIVMVILGLLTSLVAPNLFQRVDSAREQTVKSQIQMLSTAVDTYRLDMGRFPDGLDDLVESSEPRWQGPYVERIPDDPWDRPYQFQAPGEHGSYDLYSQGPDDGEPIGNWEIEE